MPNYFPFLTLNTATQWNLLMFVCVRVCVSERVSDCVSRVLFGYEMRLSFQRIFFFMALYMCAILFISPYWFRAMERVCAGTFSLKVAIMREKKPEGKAKCSAYISSYTK